MWRPTLGLHRPGTAAKDPLPRFGHAAKSGPAARVGPAANVVGLHTELHRATGPQGSLGIPRKPYFYLFFEAREARKQRLHRGLHRGP